ncbi:hypothetical protein CCS77_1181 [Campylobacter concisus]|uniref:Uncharacterized protein n=1 Tax=Campylobacter concisus TaxID=199 RepID=A0A2R4P0N1_9BACT|nr:hypothetical protein CCS77_1181 [Campylobacter concisus]ERJ28273.1 hypothetical protein ATCC51561_478 [Campylobacter concisus ATCC 51561]
MSFKIHSFVGQICCLYTLNLNAKAVYLRDKITKIKFTVLL